MGLETTATHAIWLVALLTAAGIGADQLTGVEPELREAREQARRSASVALQTMAHGPIFCHDAAEDLIALRARNAGDVAIDTRNVTFVVDGVLRTGWVVDIEGIVNAGDWRPGELAWFNLSEPDEPDRIVVHTAQGVPIYPLKTTCPRLTTIVVSPSAPSVLTSASQAFTAVGYDQFGTVVPTSFTWAASRGSITQEGLFTAPTTVGATVVYANASGVSGTANVTVLANVNVLSIVTYNAGVPASSFARGETVEVRVIVRDQAGNLVPGASVTVEFRHPPNDQLAHTGSGTTDSSGVASISHTLANNARRDTWTISVPTITGAGLTYVPGSNAQSTQTIQVT